MRNTAPKEATELEALETREWLDSLDYVLESGGPDKVAEHPYTSAARIVGGKLSYSAADEDGQPRLL